MNWVDQQVNAMLYPEVEAGYQAWAVMKRIAARERGQQVDEAWRRQVARDFDRVMHRWPRVWQRWEAKHK